MVVRLIVFAVASGGLALLFRESLRDPRSRGFFRFFAFESVLALLILNLPYWSRDPFSAPQIVSWILLIVSLFLVIHGFYLLRVAGRPQGNIENTTILVRRGAYRYIRHPLYSSLLFLGWGVFFKAPWLLTGLLALAASICLYAAARAEEAENLQKFGDEYAAYMQTTKRFIPFLF
jgi:protein-S-isoprenylcysteine O-methyltransferase Ste14